MKFACSSFSWQTKDGLHLLGRTYDQFGDLKANRVVGVPKGIPCSPGTKADPSAPPSLYSYTGMAVLGFGEPILVDGVNESGLMGALLHYPEYAYYEKEAKPGQTAVHPGRLLSFLLGQCARLTEVISLMSDIALIDDMSLGSPLPAHYIISDKSGETIIIEPDHDGIHIHRQTIGVLTNSPDYIWQRTNLRTYVGVTNLPKAPQYIDGHEIREFGERLGGGFGLPGDYSSPSRFIRMAFMKEFAVKGNNELDGVSRMFRSFAPVDIPEGLAKADPNYDVYEQTLCTSVMCAESGIYYFAPAQNRRISAVRPLTQAGTANIVYYELGDCQDVDYRN